MKPPLGTRPPAVALGALLLLGACSSRELRSSPPPLADMEEPPALHAEPDDEAARQALPKGCFSGLSVSEGAASLDELADGGTGGVLVSGVVENSPADLAGLAEGDLLLEATPAGRDRVPLDHPSVWRKLELETPPGTAIRLTIDRAGAARTTELVLVPRVRPAHRAKAERYREEARVGIVLRTATEVEARSAGLGPGGGAVLVGSARSSPWRLSGLRLGDLLVAIDGRPVTHPGIVLDAIREASDEAQLRVDFVRDGVPATVAAPVTARTGEVSTLFLPPLVDYESERGTSETSVLLGLVKVTETKAAWELRLLWFIKFGGGDADTLEEIRP